MVTPTADADAATWFHDGIPTVETEGWWVSPKSTSPASPIPMATA
jgi:hypothetical protein